MATLDNVISGTFTSDGTAVTLPIRCDVDYIFTENLTQLATTQATGRAVKCEYHRNMAADSQIRTVKTNNTDAVNMVVDTSGGFTLVDTSLNTLGGALTSTGITNAAPPVVSLASTAGLSNGDIVRVTNSTGALQIAGMDFTIGNLVANTSVELSYMVAPGSAATSATIRKVNYQPIYYPRRRFITAITKASSAVVTLSVTHGLTVGQRVVFNVPAAFGMTEINSLRGQITAINTTTNTVTVNIDSTSFTTFAFPATTGVPFTFAQLIPFGDAPATVANVNADQSVLDGATDNQAILGVRLAAGVQSPAGSNGDVIRWVAYKSSQYIS